MDVILISLAICILGVMVTVLLFSVAMRPEENEAAPRSKHETPSERFFMEEWAESKPNPEAPSNALLLDLERHVRTEHEAAKAFLRGPTPDSLHAPSDSPLWH